ncbi:MAG: thioredoxin domain-containing protein [Halobacteriales archaeon]|nr:thioredoxin domain-containing protein [Halobacteriales archaeon]
MTRNRLKDEKSPYLRRHADNPVHWNPWDEEAFAEAEERDVPIFLSVGYSACHWCHVMEDESFEDEETARILNENFVPIKVDREERPDVDSIYQKVCQMTTGQGGWPLSVFLTPDGRPFYVGTYYPGEPRRGMPSFTEVLESVAEAWENKRDDIENRADDWTKRVESADSPDAAVDASDEPDDDLVVETARALVEEADRKNGGFGRGQKFPHPLRVDVLLRAWERTDRNVFLDVPTETADAWVRGGLHDHVGGGFHRYCVDSDWTVPHFEKMLYDNAEISRALLDAYRVAGDERYADAVRRTFDFLEREMRSPEGAFYSTLDAQSVRDETDEREEGAFYVWTPDEIRDALDDEDAELFVERYGVTDAGNFEGSNVLKLSKTVEELAEERGESVEETRRAVERVREKAREAREERPRPPRDEKVLASWNGLTVSALALGGVVLDESYAELAEDALGFIRGTLWDDENGSLSRRYKDGEVKVDGYLDDYAFVARGALDLFGATSEPKHLRFALELGRAVVSEFQDETGVLYYTSESGEKLVTRPRETTDTSTPASSGVATDVLVALSAFDDYFGEPARKAVEAHVGDAERRPVGHESTVLAVDRHTNPLEVVPADEHDAWRDALGTTYAPGALVAPRPPTDEELEDWKDELGMGDASVPVWDGREARDEGTGYVCRNFTCSPPVEPDALGEWLARLRP